MNVNQSAWRRVRFDEMAENIGIRVDDPAKANVDRYVGLEHLDSERLTVRRWGAPADVDATKLRFARGDIIFGKRRAYQRKSALASFDGICSAHAMVLRAKQPTTSARFLSVFTQSSLFLERALAISAGSLSPTISWKSLAVQEFPLPPKEEQEQIADLVWAAEESASSTEVAAEAAWLVEKRLLEDIYADPEWPIVRVDAAGEVQLGRMQHPKYQAGKQPRPYLRVANVHDDRLALGDVLHMDFDEVHFAKYHLQAGDILLNEGQSIELVGRSAIYRGEIENCCYQKSLLRFRSGDDVLPEFAHGWFRRTFYRGDFARNSTKTTSLANLTAVRFAAMSFPLPPVAVQNEIVDRVAEARNTRRQLEEHAATSRQLVRALIDRIFSEGD